MKINLIKNKDSKIFFYLPTLNIVKDALSATDKEKFNFQDPKERMRFFIYFFRYRLDVRLVKGHEAAVNGHGYGGEMEVIEQDR